MGRSDRPNQRLEALIDRIEDRLIDAPIGLHRVGEPATAAALAQASLSEDAAGLWGRWDGIEFGNAEARLLSLADQILATEEAKAAGILREGDRVIGEIGLALLIAPADPWDEGGEVVMVEDDGERAPYASSVVRLALGLIAEMSVLYDDDGEYREGLFEEHGDLTPKAERRLLRRRLDFDEDAPFPRFRLGQLLRRGGELRAARAELRRVLRCAPEFCWAHWELGRVELEVAASDEAGDARTAARQSFAAAAEKASDSHLRALFLAWQAWSSDGAERERVAAEVLQLDPGFASAREAGLREAIEDEDRSRAQELLGLALAVAPRQLGLLELRAAVEALPVVERSAGTSDAEDEHAPTPDVEPNAKAARIKAGKADSRRKPGRSRKR
ncbi:hypothetical protein DB30_02406 [Enhygromyxa salina]|uniref:Tetratricopeptide repeat protein n=1 Tax=Enhygromyxa salina TaxID=215803 RepID=A0A0C1Z2W3_9BACT|nr:hypothetical protein [Enhygromyxa salina]KIG11854.1 hypothetical protein DB30_02406 [Enhygromyxa salina]